MTFAFPLEPFCEYQSILSIQVGAESAAFALDALSNLPQSVGVVGCMCLAKGCINACAVQELIEQLLVGPFMDGLIAFGALQVSCGFLKVMNIRGGRMFLLELEQGCNAACSGGFLPNCPVWW